MAVGARCKGCGWQVEFPATYVSAAEVAALADHVRDCKVVGGKPVDPQSAASVLDRFAITDRPVSSGR
jgi:hypothetical protein